MSITLIAVVIALVVGHTMPALVSLRRYDWFIRWLEWLAAQLGDNAAWRGAAGLLFAIGPPLLLVALLQIALRGDLLRLPRVRVRAGCAVLCLGPARPRPRCRSGGRTPPTPSPAAKPPRACSPNKRTRRSTAARWSKRCSAARCGAGSACCSGSCCSVPFGALLYRLVSLCAQGEARKRLPEGASQAARTVLAFLDWPVAQLMTLSLALVGNFDSVFQALEGRRWRRLHGRHAVPRGRRARQRAQRAGGRSAGRRSTPNTSPTAAWPSRAACRACPNCATR